MGLPTGTGEADSSQAGLMVHAVPLYEDDPKYPGKKRIVRDDEGRIIYTPESVAKYKALESERAAARNATDSVNSRTSGVESYYEKELWYQEHPETPRPRSGLWSKAIEVPDQFRKKTPLEEIPIEQDKPIVIPNLPKPAAKTEARKAKVASAADEYRKFMTARASEGLNPAEANALWRGLNPVTVPADDEE